MAAPPERFVFAARLADLKASGCLVRQVGGHTLALFQHNDTVYAIDNRCPHMGFPLDRGTVRDGILICHWHHARFDLASGGTFDLWADDARVYPVQVRGNDIYVDLSGRAGDRTYLRQRLRDGLERDLPLVIAKSVIGLLAEPTSPISPIPAGSPEEVQSPAEPLRIGLEFGTQYRAAGWGQGLTILTCLANLLPFLDEADHARALYQGLSAVAADTGGQPPRFAVRSLPSLEADLPTLKRWFRQFVEVRDAEGAERCIVSAVRTRAEPYELANMLFAAATDHRYIQGGHVLDFTNKAFEALDLAGWEQAASVLGSLASAYAAADRSEESNAWRHPVDLVAILERTFERLPSAVKSGRGKRGATDKPFKLVPVLLGDNPQDIADILLAAIREGRLEEDLAAVVAYAAALRIAQFHTSNEVSDWDTALHTFTFANAVHQGLRRIRQPAHDEPYIPLLRGVFDAAMSIYLDRFLNIPPARLPEPDGTVAWDPDVLLTELPRLLDRQQQVDESARLVAGHLYVGGDPSELLAVMGHALLREDRDFHTIQCVEAATRQYSLLGESDEGAHILIAAARYLAAHAPTMRAQDQTYQIAARLQRGDKLFEG
jgi:nitrite reductase/ring-hydroxylating ferredoxin subunit